MRCNTAPTTSHLRCSFSYGCTLPHTTCGVSRYIAAPPLSYPARWGAHGRSRKLTKPILSLSAPKNHIFRVMCREMAHHCTTFAKKLINYGKLRPTPAPLRVARGYPAPRRPPHARRNQPPMATQLLNPHRRRSRAASSHLPPPPRSHRRNLRNRNRLRPLQRQHLLHRQPRSPGQPRFYGMAIQRPRPRQHPFSQRLSSFAHNI